MIQEKLDIERLKNKIINMGEEIEWRPILELSQIRIPEFPLDIFPNRIKKFIVSMADNIQVSVECVAMTYISVFSGAVANKFLISPKKGWSETLNLYVVIVAGPSERKSVVCNQMTQVLFKAVDCENEQRKEEIAKQEAEILLLKNQISEIESINVSKLNMDDREKLSDSLSNLYIELEKLESSRLYELELFVSNITPEKIPDTMQKNKGFFSIISPEGAEIFDIMGGLYSKRVNLDVFLKAYSGDRLSQSRVSLDKTITVNRPVLSMGLFVQPSVISSMPKKFAERGLMQRFLYCYPISLAGYRNPDSPYIYDEGINYYEETIQNLLLFSIKGEQIEFTLSNEAYLEFNKIRSVIEKMHLVESYSDSLKGWIGKFEGNLARIIGLMHIMENLDDLNNMPYVVSEATVKRASYLTDYIIANAEKAFGVLERMEISKDVQVILRRIKSAYGNCTVIEYQQLWQDFSKKFKRSHILRQHLQYLEEMNYVKLIKDRNNRNKEMVYIHPELVNLVKD